MKKMSCMFVLAAGLMGASSAFAADKFTDIDFASIVNSPEAQKAGIDGSVKFYLKGSRGSSGQMLGEGVSNKRTNSVGKSTETACRWAALSALKSFQQSAKERGATKVVNLVSYYKKNESASATTIQCVDGGMMTAVTLKGSYAK